jgi:hypothetical protein
MTELRRRTTARGRGQIRPLDSPAGRTGALGGGLGVGMPSNP